MAEQRIYSGEDLKNLGNSAFKEENFNEAIKFYTEALQLEIEPDLRAILYRNRAMAKLKLEDYEGCENDSTIALEHNGYDAKALFRRATAREQLQNFSGALNDSRDALRLEPNNSGLIDLFQRLMKAATRKQEEVQSLTNKVTKMEELAFDNNSTDVGQRITAMNNLMVLVRDSEAAANAVWNNGRIVTRIFSLVDNKEADEELTVAATRVLDEIAKSSRRAMQIIEAFGIAQLARNFEKRSDMKFVEAYSVVLQRFFNALAAMDRKKEQKPDPEIAEKNKLHIIRLILELEQMLTDPEVRIEVRETIIDLFVRNLMHMDGGLPRGWSWKFVEDRGLLKLLDLATQIPEQCEYPVSAETRQHLAICLTKLHDDMVFDTKRAEFKEKLDLFYNALMERADDPKVKIKIASLLITLLQGPVDLGLNLVTSDKITAIMLEMASSDDHLQQSLAAELIVQTVSKHERATTIIKVGMPVLKKLYKSNDDNVKVRALVGLCKCASAGGDDPSRQTMPEGSTLKLASTCKEFLLDINKLSVDVRRFACEALSYLSLDADVKEWIAEDPLLLRALLSLAKSAGALCVYALASIYVNLTNSYEKPKIDEELVKLAQFAKHHVPETHPKDTDDCVERRVRLLVADGATSACVAVSKTESENAMELLARAMLAFTEFPEIRGQILSEGGAKLLLHLTKSATPEGKIKASHAIARLGTQADPSIAFPGQRAYEVVRPLGDILHPDIEGRANYDALLTLTNLASVSDSIRKRIIKEKIIPKAEDYWFMVEHPHLRAAAAELLLNLLYCDQYFDLVVKPGSDRLKLWVLYSAEEDERLALASSAGFAILTENESVCQRIIDELKSWPEVLKDICMSESPQVQRRGIMAIANMIESSEKVASELISSEIFQVLIAITKLKDKNRSEGKKEAERALLAAEKWKLIKPTDREIHERNTGLSTITED